MRGFIHKGPAFMLLLTAFNLFLLLWSTSHGWAWNAAINGIALAWSSERSWEYWRRWREDRAIDENDRAIEEKQLAAVYIGWVSDFDVNDTAPAEVTVNRKRAEDGDMRAILFVHYDKPQTEMQVDP